MPSEYNLLDSMMQINVTEQIHSNCLHSTAALLLKQIE